jgi:Domain of unknown function (DUF4258)
MNLKKILPVLLLLVMAVIAISIRRCNSNSSSNSTNNKYRSTENTQGTARSTGRNRPAENKTTGNRKVGLDRKATDLYFTKHAKCRMKCRHITQQEVKDILANGEINYSKSELQNQRGATYAVEGMTRDRQRVRIIFAPKKAHLTVVTVIDLEVEYECHCA